MTYKRSLKNLQKAYAPLIFPVTIVVSFATAIFLFRNLTFFQFPNFFVEDATVLYNNIYTTNPASAILTTFNGYLIIGQYLLAYFASGLNFLFGNELYNLPVVTAFVSCAFLGFTASLPYILFRKELGTFLSILTVIFTALVPMYSYDYAIIGSLSNLKFTFFYIAFLLIIYRIHKINKISSQRIVFIDLALLLCVLTNASVVFILPFILLTYTKNWRSKIIKRDIPVLSAVAIVSVSFLYLVLALIKGVSAMPGYLDGPFRMTALLPILERTIFYEWTYPITGIFNSYFVTALFFITVVGAFYIYHKSVNNRLFIALTAWAMIVSTSLLILNRPGVSEYFLIYGHKGGTDQFFFAQNMIAIFATGWLLRKRILKLGSGGRLWIVVGVALYLCLALPYGTSFGGSAIVYTDMRPIKFNLDKACKEYAQQDKVVIQVYPTPYWQWHIDRDLVCK